MTRGGLMEKKQQKSRFKTMLSRAITIVSIVVFVYSAYKLGSAGLEYRHNRQVLKDVQEIYEELDVAETETGTTGEIRPQFLELHTINPDIVGWITIDDTKINYPILQGADNDYYLNRNYKNESSVAGSIFMDYRIDLENNNPNTVIYGHRMKDDTMFNSLTKYADKEFFDAHQTVYYDTLYGSYDAEVFAVYYTTTDFYYIQTDFASKDEFGTLLDNIQEKSMYQTDVQLDEDDQIITLSTCDYTLDPDRGRLVVHAKLVDKQ